MFSEYEEGCGFFLLVLQETSRTEAENSGSLGPGR